MSNLDLFKKIYLCLFISYSSIRIYYSKHRFSTKYIKSINPFIEKFNSLLAGIGMIYIPLFSIFSSYFDYFSINFSNYIKIISSIILFFDVIFFYFTHKQLSDNWSPYLEIKENHKLITNGVYKYIRHPMYTQCWIMVFFQGLILSNIFVEIFGIICWGILYFKRISNEEKMMIDEFGNEYKEYMNKTGRLFPPFRIFFGKNKLN